MPKAELPAIVLAGFGAPEALQLTLDAQQCAARAGRVLTVGLPSRLRTILQRQGIEVRELDSAFDDSDLATAYARIAATVLTTAEEEPPAVFLSPGSPLLLNSITRYVVVEARARKLSVLTLPGVSTFDAVIADLGVDVSAVGLQVLSARGLIARPQGVNPRMPLLLLEAGAVTVTCEARDSLAVALRRTYPDAQPVTVLTTAAAGMKRSTATLGKLAEITDALDVSAAFFIDIARGEPALPVAD